MAAGLLVTAAKWHATVPCHGKTSLFFPGHAESPRQAAARTARAKQLCMSCPHRDRCRELAGPVDERGVSRYSGIWAGEVRLNIDDVRRTRRDAKRRKAS